MEPPVTIVPAAGGVVDGKGLATGYLGGEARRHEIISPSGSPTQTSGAIRSYNGTEDAEAAGKSAAAVIRQDGDKT